MHVNPFPWISPVDYASHWHLLVCHQLPADDIYTRFFPLIINIYTSSDDNSGACVVPVKVVLSMWSVSIHQPCHIKCTYHLHPTQSGSSLENQYGSSCFLRSYQRNGMSMRYQSGHGCKRSYLYGQDAKVLWIVYY